MAIKITSKTILDTSSPFIEYWDIVIEQWLRNQYGRIELKEQINFASDLKIDLESVNNRLPEPYWGDPENCSFVIVNYNPGTCQDSRHNYRFCADADNCMIHEIKKSKYSGFVKSFPLYRDLSSTESWFADSIGREWWQKQKSKWIQELIKTLYINQSKTEQKSADPEKLPFVMELCAWHSVSWYGINNRNFKKHKNIIEDKVFDPLKKIIKMSDIHIGLCFGKRIGTEFLDRFVKLNELSLIVRGNNYSIYSFENNNYIINYWDDRNHRNRYPQNANDIITILRNTKITKVLQAPHHLRKNSKKS
jgi:hypothetical protein